MQAGNSKQGKTGNREATRALRAARWSWAVAPKGERRKAKIPDKGSQAFSAGGYSCFEVSACF